MHDERALIRAGLVEGRDFCAHALELSQHGRVPAPEHLTTCRVCIRRWRVTEAEFQGWTAMSHECALAVLPRMAAIFTSPERPEPYRAFYGHLARCAGCERQLAKLTVTRPEPGSGGAGRSGSRLRDGSGWAVVRSYPRPGRAGRRAGGRRRVS